MTCLIVLDPPGEMNKLLKFENVFRAGGAIVQAGHCGRVGNGFEIDRHAVGPVAGDGVADHVVPSYGGYALC